MNKTKEHINYYFHFIDVNFHFNKVACDLAKQVPTVNSAEKQDFRCSLDP
jgi:hypothetical protein